MRSMTPAATFDARRGENVLDSGLESSELVERGAALAAQAYGKSVFPAMDTNWETHPNNIGHDDFPGCMRCHDGEMSTDDGEHTIPVDCETCHIVLAETERLETSTISSPSLRGQN